jgi:hypothetical protein
LAQQKAIPVSTAAAMMNHAEYQVDHVRHTNFIRCVSRYEHGNEEMGMGHGAPANREKVADTGHCAYTCRFDFALSQNQNDQPR